MDEMMNRLASFAVTHDAYENCACLEVWRERVPTVTQGIYIGVCHMLRRQQEKHKQDGEGGEEL